MPGTETIRGHVEKRKEWIRRARDYQEKNNKLRQLKRKALERNPDEFHFHMIKSQVGFDGVHRDFDDSSDEEESETQKLLCDVRDLRYVKHKHSVELRKIEKLKSTLHFSGRNASKRNRVVFTDDGKQSTKAQAASTGSDKVESNELEAENRKAIEKERKKQYQELKKRVDRASELRIVAQKLELKRDLALQPKNSVKPKLVKKGGPTKPAVYKWTYERKR